jgi:hypothetical protein
VYLLLIDTGQIPTPAAAAAVLLLPPGTILSLVYLLLLGALAGAIPVIFELAGCLLTLGLKLAYDHTQWGRQQQAQQAAEMEQQLCEAVSLLEQERSSSVRW